MTCARTANTVKGIVYWFIIILFAPGTLPIDLHSCIARIRETPRLAGCMYTRDVQDLASCISDASEFGEFNQWKQSHKTHSEFARVTEADWFNFRPWTCFSVKTPFSVLMQLECIENQVFSAFCANYFRLHFSQTLAQSHSCRMNVMVIFRFHVLGPKNNAFCQFAGCIKLCDWPSPTLCNDCFCGWDIINMAKALGSFAYNLLNIYLLIILIIWHEKYNSIWISRIYHLNRLPSLVVYWELWIDGCFSRPLRFHGFTLCNWKSASIITAQQNTVHYVWV